MRNALVVERVDAGGKLFDQARTPVGERNPNDETASENQDAAVRWDAGPESCARVHPDSGASPWQTQQSTCGPQKTGTT